MSAEDQNIHNIVKQYFDGLKKEIGSIRELVESIKKDQDTEKGIGEAPAFIKQDESSCIKTYDSSPSDLYFIHQGEKDLHRYSSMFRDFFADVEKTKPKNIEIHFLFSPRPSISVLLEDTYLYNYSIKEALERCLSWEGLKDWSNKYYERTKNG